MPVASSNAFQPSFIFWSSGSVCVPSTVTVLPTYSQFRAFSRKPPGGPTMSLEPGHAAAAGAVVGAGASVAAGAWVGAGAAVGAGAQPLSKILTPIRIDKTAVKRFIFILLFANGMLSD